MILISQDSSVSQERVPEDERNVFDDDYSEHHVSGTSRSNSNVLSVNEDTATRSNSLGSTVTGSLSFDPRLSFLSDGSDEEEEEERRSAYSAGNYIQEDRNSDGDDGDGDHGNAERHRSPFNALHHLPNNSSFIQKLSPKRKRPKPNLTLQIPSSPKGSFTSKHSFSKVTADDLEDLDFALNDALKSALPDQTPRVASNFFESNNNSFSRHDLESGLFTNSSDIELASLNQLDSGNNNSFAQPTDSRQQKDQKSTLLSTIKQISKSLNADNDDNEQDNEDDGDDNEVEEAAMNRRLSVISSQGSVNDHDSLSIFHSHSDTPNNGFGNDLDDLISVYHSQLDENVSLIDPFADDQQPEQQRQQQSQETLDHSIEGLPLFGKSLGIFPTGSFIRQKCFKISNNIQFKYLIAFLLVAQLPLVTIQQFSAKSDYIKYKKYQTIDWILFIFYIIYTLDSLFKIVSYGFYDDSQMFKKLKIERVKNILQIYYQKYYQSIKKTLKNRPSTQIKESKEDNDDEDDDNDSDDKFSVDRENINVELHRAYLRSDWNKIDFISIVCFWVSFILAMCNGKDIGNCQVFRSLMLLKLFRILNYSKSSRMVLRGIHNAVVQSKTVIGFLLCFWGLLSIVGVESFKASLRRQCLWVNPNDPSDTYLNELQFCGSYLDPNTLEKLPYLLADGTSSGIVKGYTCPVNSICIIGENPYNGSISFDNIFHSLEMVFVIMSANTFTDIMYYTMDSDDMTSSIFFIVSTFILVIWLINLIVAVIIQSYRELAERESKMKKKQSWWSKITNMHKNFLLNQSNYVKKFRRSNSLFVIIILVNVSFSAAISQHDSRSNVYVIADCVFSVILLLEILTRFCCYWKDNHPWIFFGSVFNQIDLVLGLVDFIITIPPIRHEIGPIVFGWLSIFIIARFYRVIYWLPTLRKSWSMVFKRSTILFRMAWFGIIFLYISSLIMSRLFDGLLESTQDQPWSMDNFPNSVLSLYIITSTENWSSILYATQQATDNQFTRFCIAIYLLGWFFLSNTVLLSIFIGVISEGLELTFAEKSRNQLEKSIKDMTSKLNDRDEKGLVELVKARLETDANGVNVHMDALDMLNRVNEMLVKLGHEPIKEEDYRDKSLREELCETYIVAHFLKFYTIIKSYVITKILNIIDTIKHRNHHLQHHEIPMSTSNTNFIEIPERLLNFKHVDRSLYIFSNENIIRHTFQKWTSPPVGARPPNAQPNQIAKMIFNGFMFIISIIVVIIACYITPIYKYNRNNTFSYDYYLDVVFMTIFTIEFFIKIIADGFVMGPNAYLKSFWNVLDFIVLISFWITCMAVFVKNSNKLLVTFGALKALRAFRLLTITKVSLWNFEAAVVGGAKQIFLASLVSISLLLPFSFWGLNIFNGRLTVCSDGSALNDCNLESMVAVGNWQVLSPKFDSTPNLHFDTFGDSFRSLFEIVSLEGWTALLENVMNIVPDDKEPGLMTDPFNAVFVVLFNFLSIILILNLFVSIIIDSYSKKTGTAFLLDIQHSWYEVKKFLKKVNPSKRRNMQNQSRFKQKLSKLMLDKQGLIDKIINFLFFAQFMILVTEYFPYPAYGDTVREGLFMVTTGGLLIHLLSLLYVLGFKLFISNRWNVVKLIIITTSFILNSLSFGINTQGNAFVNINKSISVSVLFFAIPRVDVLNQLLIFGSASVTPLFWLLYTWFILYLVFGIALNQLFGLTRLGDNTGGNLNARTVTKSLIMLFRASFGEGWNDTMADFEVELPYCSNVGSYSDCGNKVLAQLLFMLWNILSMYVFLNIFISVVINNFSYVYHSNGEHKLLTREELRKFKRCWNKFDPLGSGYINITELYPFLSSLNGILSFHVYPQSLRIGELTKKWISNGEGYDVRVDLDVLNDLFAICNFNSIKERRKRYDRMCIEIEQSASIFEDPHGEKYQKISFRNVILAVGFYSRFKNSDCLVILDRIKYNYNLRRIQRIMKVKKNTATIRMVYTKLQWNLMRKNGGLIDQLRKSNNAHEMTHLKEKIVSKLQGTEIDEDELLEKIISDLENRSDNRNDFPDADGASFVSDLTGMTNPFVDVYTTNIYRDQS